ncbi:7084_t:CDS:10, partial [Paraglomus occultum]
FQPSSHNEPNFAALQTAKYPLSCRGLPCRLPVKMVFINGTKYACATCIKGHRSTACHHGDRTLYEIKRKGRPVTQCTHCRELRKTQRVHVKCTCNERKIGDGTQSTVSPSNSNIDVSSLTGANIGLNYKHSVEALLNPCRCRIGAKCICCRPIDEEKDSSGQRRRRRSKPNKLCHTSNKGKNNSSEVQTVRKLAPRPLPQEPYSNSLRRLSLTIITHEDIGNSDSPNTPEFFEDDSQDLLSQISYESTTPSPQDVIEPSLPHQDDDPENYAMNESEILGETVTQGSSEDLVNMIYQPFQSCTSTFGDGSCCGTRACHCGSSCSCDGCTTHAQAGEQSRNSASNSIDSDGCCRIDIKKLINPEHTIVIDEDGVEVCGCGCKKPNSACSDCVASLCEAEKIVRGQTAQIIEAAKHTFNTITSNDVKIRNIPAPVEVPISTLAHGLDRVLFNPGVHYLQDPRSRVFNFDPFLRDICPPPEFDFDALGIPYILPSKDKNLQDLARKYSSKYCGSTSSMTGVLSHVYFLISSWKPVDISTLSLAFAKESASYTSTAKSPTTIFLRYRDGIYAVEVDKSLDVENILKDFGRELEFFYTVPPGANDLLLRAQIDCHDPRLPNKTFDIKTRAAIAVRMDFGNYQLNAGYQIKTSHGLYESFEREYYDMMRAAFLKYSLQVRIGQMDGVFVAFHNTARTFGFQYIPLEEMDRCLFGNSYMGDQSFLISLKLLNEVFDTATNRFPNKTLRMTFQNHLKAPLMNVYIEVCEDDPQAEQATPLPPGPDTIEKYHVGCYSIINKRPTFHPFKLRQNEPWKLKYYISRRQMMPTKIKDEMKRAVVKQLKAWGALKETQGEEPDLDHFQKLLRKMSEKGFREMAREVDKDHILWVPMGNTGNGQSNMYNRDESRPNETR